MISLVHPLPGGRPTDPYGPRGNVPGQGNLGFHTGQDFAAPLGTPIYAAQNGVVTRKWWDAFVDGRGAGGNMIELDHGGYRTRYAHMQHQSELAVGARVTAGKTVVGRVGATGAATGTHLHFELLDGPFFVNPVPYIGLKPIPTPTPIPVKGKKVTLTNFQDRKKKTVKPNQRVYLTDARNNQVDVAPKAGVNQFNVHLYAEGLADGDSLEIKLLWIDTRKGNRVSEHYKERVFPAKGGYVRANRVFTRNVIMGEKVVVSVWASSGNKKTATVTVLDCDNLHFG